MTLRFGSADKKRELVDAAARAGVPVIHFLWAIYVEWRTRQEERRDATARS